MSSVRKQLTLTPSSVKQKKKKLLETSCSGATANVNVNMADTLERLECVVKSEMATMRSELSSHMTTMCSKIDLLTGEQREQRKTLNSHAQRLDTIEQQLVDLQDRSRRNNLRLLGLPEGMEKDDAVGFIKRFLPIWLPTLVDREFEIERAHRIYANPANNKKPRVVIFKLLRFHDRDIILREARKHGPIRLDDGGFLSFFPDYSPTTAKKRSAFTTVRRELKDKGVQTFLQYPATLKVTFNGETSFLQTPEEARQLLHSLSKATDTGNIGIMD